VGKWLAQKDRCEMKLYKWIDKETVAEMCSRIASGLMAMEKVKPMSVEDAANWSFQITSLICEKVDQLKADE
jgi:hypothetical protein